MPQPPAQKRLAVRKKIHNVQHIHFLSPYTFNLEIGGEYNRMIEMLPANSWICINDHDTLKPPGFAERVKFIIEYEFRDPAHMLIGARTNRMSSANPNVVKEMNENDSVTDHLRVSMELWQKHKTELVDNDVVAGYCMIFNKQLWERLGGFPPRTILFDSWISERSETYTAAGLYIFHLYRWHQRKNPEKAYIHLIRAGQLCTDPYFKT